MNTRRAGATIAPASHLQGEAVGPELNAQHKALAGRAARQPDELPVKQPLLPVEQPYWGYPYWGYPYWGYAVCGSYLNETRSFVR